MIFSFLSSSGGCQTKTEDLVFELFSGLSSFVCLFVWLFVRSFVRLACEGVTLYRRLAPTSAGGNIRSEKEKQKS
jgi:hypothetical protein